MSPEWHRKIQWAKNCPHSICPGDLQCVVRDLVDIVHLLMKNNEDLEKKISALEDRTKDLPENPDR